MRMDFPTAAVGIFMTQKIKKYMFSYKKYLANLKVYKRVGVRWGYFFTTTKGLSYVNLGRRSLQNR